MNYSSYHSTLALNIVAWRIDPFVTGRVAGGQHWYTLHWLMHMPEHIYYSVHAHTSEHAVLGVNEFRAIYIVHVYSPWETSNKQKNSRDVPMQCLILCRCMIQLIMHIYRNRYRNGMYMLVGELYLPYIGK